MKKKLLLVLALVMALGTFIPAKATTEEEVEKMLDKLPEGSNMVIAPNPMAQASDKMFSLFVKGSLVSDENTFLKDSRSYIPLRLVAEKLGYEVEYKEETKDIIIKNENTIVKMNVEKKTYTVNNEEKEMDVFPLLKDGTTIVPIRFVAEAFGEKVLWDQDTFTAMVGAFERKDLEGEKRTFGKVDMEMTLFKDFDQKVITEEVENGYRFYTNNQEILATIQKTKGITPTSALVPGFIVDYVDGVY